MSSFDRRALLLGCLAVSACGFAPVYGPGSGAARLRNRVAIDAPSRRVEFELQGALERNLGVADSAAYDLSYAVTLQDERVAISATNTTTRRNIIGEATYALRERTTGAIVAEGRVRSFTGFSNTGSTQATRTAREDAEDRLMQILADQITRDLTASFA